MREAGVPGKTQQPLAGKYGNTSQLKLELSLPHSGFKIQPQGRQV